MKQIKTIAICDNVIEFDRQVNEALQEGYTLVDRYASNMTPTFGGPGIVSSPRAVYYAALEKEMPAAIKADQTPQAIMAGEKTTRKRTAKE